MHGDLSKVNLKVLQVCWWAEPWSHHHDCDAENWASVCSLGASDRIELRSYPKRNEHAECLPFA